MPSLTSWQDSNSDLELLPASENLPRKLASHPVVLWLIGNARWLWPIVVIGIIFMVARSALRDIEYHTVRHAIRQMDTSWVILTGLLTIANLAVMGMYDVICLRGVHVRPIERWWIGTLSFAWSNFLTLGPLADP